MAHFIIMLFFYLKCILYIPHYFEMMFNEKLHINDFNEWKKELNLNYKYDILNFIKLFSVFPQYRNVFYYRMGFRSRLISWIAPPLNTLYINSSIIGGGLFIEHGNSTRISANRIGENVHVWQNVTIGVGHQHKNDRPKIGNNVKICTGSVVCGDIVIGDNVIIGAGSIVTKSIPDNCVVVGNPARIIKRNGVQINGEL